ncbi:MAG: response regulator [Oscillochloris sp.]|nr:response regulator [Oscillochloris sp.]
MHHIFATPAPTGGDDPLVAWRQRTIRLLLRLMLLIGIPVSLVDGWNLIRLGNWQFLLFGIVAFSLLGWLTLNEGLGYRLRGAIVVGIFLIAGARGLLVFGVLGINPTLLIVSVILAMLLLGPEAAIIVGLICGSIVVAVFSSFGLGIIPNPAGSIPYLSEVPSLIDQGLLLAGIIVMLVFVLRSLITELQHSLQATHNALAELAQTNTSLESIVAQRTADADRAAALLQAMQRVSRVGGSAFDPQRGILEWSQELYQIHEVPPGTFIDQTLLRHLYPGESANLLRVAITNLLDNGEAYELELRAQTANGRPIWVRASGAVDTTAGQSRLIGAVQDITTQKAHEQIMAQQVRYAEALSACARLLLTYDESDDPAWSSVQAALDRLRTALITSRLFVYRYDGEPPNTAVTLMIESIEPTAPTFIDLPLDWSDVPPEMVQMLQQRRPFGGPTRDMYREYPRFRQLFDRNNIQSWLIVPITVGDRLWGHMGVSSQDDPRIWSKTEINLLTTAVEMVVAFIQRQEYMNALSKRELLIQSIGNSLPRGIIFQMVRHRDGSGEFLYISAGVADRWGVTPEAVYADAEALWSRILPEDRPGFEQTAIKAARALSPFEHEMRFRGADGTIHWSLSRSTAQLLPDGRVLRSGVEIDITDRKQAELALAASEAKYRTLFALLPVGVTLADANGQVYEVNPAAERFLAINQHDHTARTIDDAAWDIIKPDGSPFPAEEFPSVRASRDRFVISDVEMGVARPDGRYSWLNVSAAPLPLPPYGVVITYSDMTAQRQIRIDLEQARDAAEAAARAKSAFLANMSHEIRTPLNAVIGMADLLQNTALNAEQRIFVDTILIGGEALLAVINDILDFSRIDSGVIELAVAPFDLPSCLQSAIDLVKHQAAVKGLDIACVIESSLPQMVSGDAHRLRQILLNLLGNAVKFTNQGRVTLHAAAQPLDATTVNVTICVCDTGIGITPEQLDRIFAPFVQADTSTNRRYGGTGLGLAISRQLVGLMHGSIDVHSSPGDGSTFLVQIPFPLAAPPHNPALVDRATADRRILQVLIAEDNPINQEVTRLLVQRLNHRATVVGDGRAALAAVQAAAYDVILMDINMPDLDGIAATQAIRRLGPGIRQPQIIALTANALADDRERFLQAGMDDYLSKPVQPEALEHAFAQVRFGNIDPTHPAEAAEFQELIRWSVLEHTMEAFGPVGPETAVIVLEIFEQMIAPELDDIERSIAAGTREQVRRAAHQLRGGCLQMGAQSMAELCRQLEYADPATDPAVLLAMLRDCYHETITLLRTHYR